MEKHLDVRTDGHMMEASEEEEPCHSLPEAVSQPLLTMGFNGWMDGWMNESSERNERNEIDFKSPGSQRT